MLILSRREGESICIYNAGYEQDISRMIKIKYMGMNPNSQIIQLGILAPEDISIHREEIYHRIMEREYGCSVRR